MADTLKVTVTNTTDGPKIFNGIMPALLHPRQKTGPLEVTEAELKSMRETGYFEIEGGPAAAESGPLDLSVEKLTAHIAGVDDAAEIDKLLEGEKAGKARSGAISALEARRAELQA